jgi:hypothetical protein
MLEHCRGTTETLDEGLDRTAEKPDLKTLHGAVAIRQASHAREEKMGVSDALTERARGGGQGLMPPV